MPENSNRLTVITTRTGDDGFTSLGDGKRVSKSSLRISAMGDVDELNSHLGLLLSLLRNCQQVDFTDIADILSPAQHALFDIGSELAIPGYQQLEQDKVIQLEQHVQRLNGQLHPLKEFILPGGDAIAAQAHVARSVCRRAERSIISVTESEMLGSVPQQYLNRLSDLLFIVARIINLRLGQPDTLWQR